MAFSSEKNIFFFTSQSVQNNKLVENGMNFYDLFYYGILARSEGLIFFYVLIYLFLKIHSFFTSQDINRWTGVMWITCGLL